MHEITANGMRIIVYGDRISINGEDIKKPSGMRTGMVSQVDDEIFIGGYQFDHKTKTFKRTLKSIRSLF